MAGPYLARSQPQWCLAIQRATTLNRWDLPKGAHYQSTLHGRVRDCPPRSIRRSPASCRVLSHGSRANPQACFRCHVGLGRKLQGAPSRSGLNVDRRRFRTKEYASGTLARRGWCRDLRAPSWFVSPSRRPSLSSALMQEHPLENHVAYQALE